MRKINRNDLTYRISSTATPEQNRALRSVASKVDRNAVEVVAPNADRYMDRKEVGCISSGIHYRSFDLSIPRG